MASWLFILRLAEMIQSPYDLTPSIPASLLNIPSKYNTIICILAAQDRIQVRSLMFITYTSKLHSSILLLLFIYIYCAG